MNYVGPNNQIWNKVARIQGLQIWICGKNSVPLKKHILFSGFRETRKFALTFQYTLNSTLQFTLIMIIYYLVSKIHRSVRLIIYYRVCGSDLVDLILKKSLKQR